MKGPKESIHQQLLLVRCQRGDRAAMEELVVAWERRLFYYVHRMVDREADAWDVLQEVWLRVFRGLASLKEPRAFPCWLYRLARNAALSHLRRRRPGARRSLEALDRSEALPAEDGFTAAFDDAEAVHDALGRISAEHREALTLFFLDDLSIDEIGRVIGVPEGTVKSRLHYAKCALREAMEERNS